MYRIAICDDQKEYLDMIDYTLHNYCRTYNISITLKSYDNSDTLVEEIENKKLFDAYILDIEMTPYSGIEIAKIIESYSSTACIVFLTAFSNYAMEACGMNIFRYVLKENLKESFPQVLDEVFHRLKRLENQETYIISSQRRYIKLLQREIIYIYKKQQNIVFVLLDGKEEHERTSLQKVYKKLNPKELFFLDRGIILNLFHVRKIEGQRVFMKNGYYIDSNPIHITELKRFLSLYWGEIL